MCAVFIVIGCMLQLPAIASAQFVSDPATGVTDEPVIAADGSGGAHLAWIRSDGATNRPEYAHVSSAGVVSRAQWLAADDVEDLTVVRGPNGGAYVLWSRVVTTDYSVRMRFVDGAGVAGPVHELGRAPSFGYLAAASDATGRLHVAWRSAIGGNQVRYVQVDSSGAVSMPHGFAATARSIRIAVSPNGQADIAWSNMLDTWYDDRLTHARIDTAGSASAPTQLTVPGRHLGDFTVANSTAGFAQVAWTAAPDASPTTDATDAESVRITEAGQVGAVRDLGTAYAGSRPHVAARAASAVITWTAQTGPSAYEARSTRVDVAGDIDASRLIAAGLLDSTPSIGGLGRHTFAWRQIDGLATVTRYRVDLLDGQTPPTLNLGTSSSNTVEPKRIVTSTDEHGNTHFLWRQSAEGVDRASYERVVTDPNPPPPPPPPTDDGGAGTGGGTGGGGAVEPIVNGGGESGLGPEPACAEVTTRALGTVRARGCFRTSGSTLIATGAVDVQGLKIVPVDNAAVTFNTATLTLSTTAAVKIYLGDVHVATGAIPSWSLQAQLPSRCWSIASGAKLRGLALTGQACVRMRADGTAGAEAYAALPKLNATAKVTMSLELGKGLKLDSINASAEQSDLPSVGVLKDISLKYEYTYENGTSSQVWTGGASLATPQPLGVSGRVDATIRDGSLERFAADARKEIRRPLGTTGVFINWIQLRLEIGQGLTLGGDLNASFGPKIGGAAIAEGTLSITFRSNGRCDGYKGADSAPNVRLGGELEFVELVQFNGSVCGMLIGFATIDGTATLGTEFEFTRRPFSAEIEATVVGRLEGWLEQNDAFSLAGSTKVTFAGEVEAPFGVSHEVSKTYSGANTLVTNKGATACWPKLDLPFIGGGLPSGIAVGWNDKKFHLKCGRKSIKVSQSAARMRTTSASASGSFQVPALAGTVVVHVVGAGAAPTIAVTSPNGTTEWSDGRGDPAVPSKIVFVKVKGQATVDAIIPASARGTWRVTSDSSSAAVTRIDAGIVTAPPTVRASVRRVGAKTVLRWASTGLAPGQSIRFVDRASVQTKTIARARTASGVVAFRPVVGLSKLHRIYAVVESGGVPVHRVMVGRFSSAKLALPARPLSIVIQRRVALLRVAWRPGIGARPSSYSYRVAFASGRVVSGRTRATSIALRGVRVGDRVQVRVTGANAAGAVGPARIARATLK